MLSQTWTNATGRLHKWANQTHRNPHQSVKLNVGCQHTQYEGPSLWARRKRKQERKRKKEKTKTKNNTHEKVFATHGERGWSSGRATDGKVAGLSPGMRGDVIFFSRVNFLCWLSFWYPFHPRVTAVARKRSWSFFQSAVGRLQINAHTSYVCGFE